ncbi:hypothetical protein EV175_005689 [Coemansia sp. RSA 1933]|nr:hypothetical protein EV175_005689 [Coemansia sp. RSA 1933]
MSPVAIAASFKEAAKALAAGDEEPLTCAGSQYGLENSSTITRSQPQSGLPTQISKRCRPDTASYRETCIGKEKEHGVWPLATPSSSGSYISSIGSGIDSSSNTISSFGIGIDSNSSSVGRSDISTITTSSSNDAAFVFNGFGPMPGTLDLSQPGYDSEDDFIVVDEGEIMPAPELLSRWSNKWQRLSLRRKLWLKVESSKRSEQKRPLLMR